MAQSNRKAATAPSDHMDGISNKTQTAARRKRLYTDMLAIIERNVTKPPDKCPHRVVFEAQLSAELAGEQRGQAEQLPVRSSALQYTPHKTILDPGMSDGNVHSTRTSHSLAIMSSGLGAKPSAAVPSHSKTKPVVPGLQHHRYKLPAAMLERCSDSARLMSCEHLTLQLMFMATRLKTLCCIQSFAPAQTFTWTIQVAQTTSMPA